jgi:hypothetical protein
MPVLRWHSAPHDCCCRYYTAVCFPQLFEHPSMREDMVERAIGVRINLGHHVSTSNPAVLLRNLMAQQESRVLYAAPNTSTSLFMRVFSLLSGSICFVRMNLIFKPFFFLFCSNDPQSCLQLHQAAECGPVPAPHQRVDGFPAQARGARCCSQPDLG